MARKSSWVQHSWSPTICGGGEVDAIRRPISRRRGRRCLEMYFRPQQLRVRMRRSVGGEEEGEEVMVWWWLSLERGKMDGLEIDKGHVTDW